MPVNRPSTDVTRQASLLAVVVLVAACRFGGSGDEERIGSGATEVKAGFNLLKPEQDVEIGRNSKAEIERQLPMLQTTSAEAYVNRIGARLVEHAPGPRFPYEFRVVNASDLNAFALPGGPIYINRGVLESATSEGEVAGVLAHEIAHVALRHGTHNVSKAYVTRAGIGLLGGLLGRDMSSGTAAIVNVLGGFGLNALFLKYSRTAETQADVVGMNMMVKGGYAPEEMIGFFRTLQRSDQRRVVGWLSDHPSPERRIEKLEAEARQYAATARSDNSALEQLQRELHALPAARTLGELSRQTASNSRRSTGAITRAQIEPPSPQLAVYQSPSGLYEVAYPSNWQVLDAEGEGVTFAPRGGAGSIGDSLEIVYGAIVNHYAPIHDDAASARMQRGTVTVDEATSDLIEQITKASPHLKVIGRATDPAGSTVVTMRGISPPTRIDEEVRLVTRLVGDGHLIFMLFVTPRSEAAGYTPTFEAMKRSLRVKPGHGHSADSW